MPIQRTIILKLSLNSPERSSLIHFPPVTFRCYHQPVFYTYHSFMIIITLLWSMFIWTWKIKSYPKKYNYLNYFQFLFETNNKFLKCFRSVHAEEKNLNISHHSSMLKSTRIIGSNKVWEGRTNKAAGSLLCGGKKWGEALLGKLFLG